jgi:hypothetical protein
MLKGNMNVMKNFKTAAAPIKSVTVNGKPWTEFNKDKETITLKGLTGTVAVTTQY